MTLTNQEIWNRYNTKKTFTKVEIKRRLSMIETFVTELITNGDFATDTDWTKGAGWGISGGSANASSSTGSSLSQDAGLKAGFKYKIIIQVKNYASGSLKIKAGDISAGQIVNSSGYHEIVLRALGNSTLYFEGVSSFTGSIDNVSVKEVYEYEQNWYDISEYILKGTVPSITQRIPDNLWEFGLIDVGSARLKFRNKHGEMSDESNLNSIFNNYIRHDTWIRIISGYVDYYTDPDTPVQVETEIFQGFIDDRTGKTGDTYEETFTAKSLVSILSGVTVADLGTLTKTNVNELVYEVMNRGQFAAFFEINTDLIKSGYNTTNLNLSLISEDVKVIDLLSDLAKGHSVFYVRSGKFYFQPALPTSVVKHYFPTSPEKKIQVYDFNQGSVSVIENWFWEDSTEKYQSLNTRFKTSKTFKVDFIDNATQRQNLLNYIGELTDSPKLTFKLELPFYPDIQMLDLIQIGKKQILDQRGGFILDESKLDIDILGRALGAIKVFINQYFQVIGIQHSKTNELTSITVQKVEYEDIPAIANDISDMVLGISNRLLNSNYTDYCCEIRRNNSADTAVDAGSDEERDFIFRRKLIDTYMLTKFLNYRDFIRGYVNNISSDTGYLKTWYDQSGNTYDIAMSTSVNQPKYDKTSKTFDYSGASKYIDRTS